MIVNALLLRTGAVLLARRSSSRGTYPDRWSFPGGHVEPGETLAQALGRECREEIGIAPVTYVAVDRVADPNAPAATPIMYHMYAVTVWDGGEPTMIGDEHSQLGWFQLGEAALLPELALEEYRPLLRKLALEFG